MIGFLAIAIACLSTLLLLSFLDLDNHHSAMGDSHHLSSALSLQGWLIFGVGLGSVGAAIRGYGQSTEIAIGGGVVFGGLLMWMGSVLLGRLKGSESDSTPSLTSLLGHTAYTRGDILPGQFGEVQLVYFGQARTLRAVADRHIPHNSAVIIDRIVGQDVHITPR